MEKHRLIIIGTGPAGLTAAIYTGRANFAPLIFEGKEPGGQLTLTTEVDNFPGFAEGIMGPELIKNMKDQSTRFGAVFINNMIVDVDLRSRPFTVTDDNGKKYSADSLIISTGASARFLGLPNEKELTGKGVSTCATCDGFFYRNKLVHVVGGGDTAMEEANFLTKFAKKVTIVHRKDKFRASKPMQDKVFKNEKIDFVYDSEVIAIKSDAKGVTGIVVKNIKTGKEEERLTDGLFYGIGHNPNTEFLKGQVALDEHGFIKTDRNMATNIPGLFACGDVQDNIFRQAITAAGSGCMAALMVEKFLDGH